MTKATGATPEGFAKGYGKLKCRYCEAPAVLWVTERDDSKSPCCAFHYNQQTSKNG